MKTILKGLAIITGVFLSRNAVADTKYEAESATLSCGATVNTNHTGYSGTGFVDGFVNSTTAQVSYAITGATGGSYTITLHYTAGGGTSTNTGLYVNGTKIKNITCPGTANWDTWADETETVTLITGNNTIAYKAETASGSCINLDYLITVGGTDACAGIQGGGAGLTGATFGLNPPYTTGSEYCKATDGSINTYYDFSQGNSGYAGLDLGSAKVINRIKYYPRVNFASRMTGGKFQGSNDGSSYTDLYTISTTPPVQWNEVTFSNSTGYRYVRYVGPNSGFSNIAEMEFYQAQTTYSLTIGNDQHGTTSPTGVVTVNQGAATAISASTNAGYLFTNWTVTSGTATFGDANSSSTNVTLSSGNATIQAHFTAHAPTDISLSPMSVAEHLPSNSLVGTFSATDVDWNSTFSFSLVSGTGSADNGSFGVVNGNQQLVTTASFDYLTKSSYSIRILVNDNTGNHYEKQFTISVTYTGVYANPTMTPAPVAELAGTTATISWTAVTGALTYDLDIGSAVGGNDIYNGTAGTATSATVSGLPSDGRTIYVRLTTTDPNGPHTYDFTYKACTVRPQATNVSITGTLQINQVATGTYTYSDADPQGTSTFKWYRADDANGTTNRAVITGATQATYTLTTADENKFVQFEVTPVAQTGVLLGLPTLSAFSAQITRGGFVFVYPEDCGPGEHMKVDGNVIIGNVISPTEKLEVAGTIKCDELRIQDWAFRQKAPDFVFKTDYKLRDLKDVESFIKQNSHLPEVPSAEEMQKNGLNITEFNMVLLKKIEELTLHAIAQEKKIEELEKRVGK